MATSTMRTGLVNDYVRIAGIFGLVTAVLVALSIILTFSSGAPPALDEASGKVMNYFQKNEGLHKMAGIVGSLILLTATIWFLGLYSIVRDRATAASDVWPRLSLVAFILSGAMASMQGASALALTLGAKDEFQGAPAVGGALFDLYNALSAPLSLAIGLFFIALGVALQQTGGFPKWWSTMLYVAGALSYVAFFAPFLQLDALAMLGLIPYIVLGILAAVTGMAMMNRGTTAPRTPTI